MSSPCKMTKKVLLEISTIKIRAMGFLTFNRKEYVYNSWKAIFPNSTSNRRYRPKFENFIILLIFQN